MNSEEVDTFVHGSDAVMYIETQLSSTPHGFPPTSSDPFQESSDSTLPPPVDSLHTSTLPPSDDTPHTSTIPQSVDTSTLPQSDDTPHTSTLLQSVDTPPTSITPQSDNSPHASTIPQSSNTPQTSTLPQSDDIPHASTLPQFDDIPQTSTLPQSDDTPHTSTIPQSDDTPQTSTLPQSVDTPPTSITPQTDNSPHASTMSKSDDTPHTSTLPQSDDTSHTSTLPQSVKTPPTSDRRQSVNTSAEERAHGRCRSSSPPPAKRRLLVLSPSPKPKRSPKSSSPRQQRSVPHKKWRTILMDRCGALPPPVIPQDRWHDPIEEDVEPRQFPFRPNRTPGVQLNLQMNYRPSEIFQLYFSMDAMQTLCSNTNKYAARKTLEGMKRRWTNIKVDEMFRLFSIVIYLGLVKTSAIRDLWRKDRLHNHPFPSSVMTGYRYEEILACLHMSDPAEDVANRQLRGQPGHDGLFSLKPLQNQILAACKAYYHPHRNIAIDERMVATKARIGMKQYMKAKPTKWGYKLFVLADSCNGYTYNFSIYEGKAKNPSGNGLSFDSVVNLIHVPSLGTGYTLYVDNFYTSPQLFLHLHRIGVGACGTSRESRVGFPRVAVNALPNNAERGDMRWIREGSLLFVKWRDTRDVKMCSTVHKAYSGRSVQRRVKAENGTWCTKSIPIPDPVSEYNKFMGGVDLSDALIKYFSVTQKTRRWYVKLFLHFIDIAVVNSFIIYKEMAQAKNQTVITQKVFRERLCLELSDIGKSQMHIPPVPKKVEKRPPPPPKRSESGPHGCFPIPVCEVSSDPHLKASKGRRKCAHCKMKTIIMCRSCKVPLCIVVDRMCFTEWHDLKTS